MLLSYAAKAAIRLLAGNSSRAEALETDFLAFVARLREIDPDAHPAAATLAFYCLRRLEDQERRIARLEEARRSVS